VGVSSSSFLLFFFRLSTWNPINFGGDWREHTSLLYGRILVTVELCQRI
jgi:hypothetical protein